MFNAYDMYRPTALFAAALAMSGLLAGGYAAAADRAPNTLSVTAGGATMINVKNGLHPAASDVGLAWTRPGGWGGFQLEANHLAFFTAYETQHLFGLRAAWTLRLPNRTLYPFATFGAGVYYSNVITVLPIGQVALGVQRDLPGRMSVAFAVVGWGSLFAVGINPRLSVGYSF